MYNISYIIDWIETLKLTLYQITLLTHNILHNIHFKVNIPYDHWDLDLYTLSINYHHIYIQCHFFSLHSFIIVNNDVSKHYSISVLLDIYLLVSIPRWYNSSTVMYLYIMQILKWLFLTEGLTLNNKTYSVSNNSNKTMCI